jgi:hypothetical protein
MPILKLYFLLLVYFFHGIDLLFYTCSASNKTKRARAQTKVSSFQYGTNCCQYRYTQLNNSTNHKKRLGKPIGKYNIIVEHSNRWKPIKLYSLLRTCSTYTISIINKCINILLIVVIDYSSVSRSINICSKTFKSSKKNIHPMKIKKWN